MTFKVGDKVRLVGPGHGDKNPQGSGSEMDLTKTYTVTSVLFDGKGAYVDEDGHYICNGPEDDWYAEVVEEEREESMSTPFRELEAASLAAMTPDERVRFNAALEETVSPNHYRFGNVEVIDITRHLGFLEGNVVKYVTRAGRKGDRVEDLLKARKYLDWAIEDAGLE